VQTDKLKRLEPGERCWMLKDGLISFVDVQEKKIFFEGEPTEFVLYKVQKVIGGYVIDPAHRSELFACPWEQQRLYEELVKDSRRLKEYASELYSRENGYMPDPEKDDI
jgi:hypothetical protein